MDNCSLEVSQVKDLQDDLNYYVESNQEPDFAENEMMYDDFELEDAQSAMYQAHHPGTSVYCHCGQSFSCCNLTFDTANWSFGNSQFVCCVCSEIDLLRLATYTCEPLKCDVNRDDWYTLYIASIVQVT